MSGKSRMKMNDVDADLIIDRNHDGTVTIKVVFVGAGGVTLSARISRVEAVRIGYMLVESAETEGCPDDRP